MDKKKYEKVFDYFGYENQRRKLTEEVQEFNDEILLYEKGIGDINSVIIELSDILNVLNGFINEYEITNEEIQNIINEKLDRTIKRIDNGYYESRKSD